MDFCLVFLGHRNSLGKPRRRKARPHAGAPANSPSWTKAQLWASSTARHVSECSDDGFSPQPLSPADAAGRKAVPAEPCPICRVTGKINEGGCFKPLNEGSGFCSSRRPGRPPRAHRSVGSEGTAGAPEPSLLFPVLNPDVVRSNVVEWK